MAVPNGFAAVRIPFVLVASPSTYGVVTFGVDFSVSSDPVDIAESVWAAYDGTMSSRLDNSFRAGPVQVSVGSVFGDLSGEGTSSALGTRSDEMEAPNVALLIQKRTSVGGRQNRGRFFWPFMLSQDDLNENGNLSGAALTDNQTAASAFLAALTTESVPMVLFHRDGGVPTVVDSLVVSPRAATQRRRLRR